MNLADYQQWHIPFSRDDITLQMALDSMASVTSSLNEAPLMISLLEKAQSVLPGVDLFAAGFDLFQHDCIHILLGRGLLAADEAFTIGFTLGCAKKTTNTEYSLYAFVSQRLYPNVHKFTEHEIAILKDAIRLSFISNCVALDCFDFSKWLDEPVGTIRDVVGIEADLIAASYAVEKRRYPHSLAAQRLLPDEKKLIAF